MRAGEHLCVAFSIFPTDIHVVSSCHLLAFSHTLLRLLMSIGDAILALSSDEYISPHSCALSYFLLLDGCIRVICRRHFCRGRPAETPSEDFEVVSGKSFNQFVAQLAQLRDVVHHGSLAQKEDFAEGDGCASGIYANLLGMLAEHIHTASLLNAYTSEGVLRQSRLLLKPLLSGPPSNEDFNASVAVNVAFLWKCMAELAREHNTYAVGSEIVELKLVLAMEQWTYTVPDAKFWNLLSKCPIPVPSRSLSNCDTMFYPVDLRSLICDTLGLLQKDSAKAMMFRLQLQIIARRAVSQLTIRKKVTFFWMSASEHQCEKCSPQPSDVISLRPLPDRICSTPGCESIQRAGLLCGRCLVPYCERECQKLCVHS